MMKASNRKAFGWFAVFLVVSAMTCFILSGCSLNEARFNAGNVSYRLAKLKTVVRALENDDVKTIKKLFSKATIEAVGEEKLEEDIAHLISQFEGKALSYDLSGNWVGEDFRGWKRTKETDVYAYVTTDVTEYFVYFPDQIFDSIDPKRVGISYLIVMRSDDYISERYGTPPEDFVGVFRTDIVAKALGTTIPDEGKLDILLDAFQNKDAAAIENIFSGVAIEEAGIAEISTGIAKIFDMFVGNEISIGFNEWSVETDIVDGKVRMHVMAEAKVATGQAEYWVSYRECIIDETKRGNVGIDQLEVVFGDDWHSYLKYHKDFVGIRCSDGSER